MITPYPALFEPLTIGHLRLRNRIMSTSHAPAYAEDGMPKERYLRYHSDIRCHRVVGKQDSSASANLMNTDGIRTIFISFLAIDENR